MITNKGCATLVKAIDGGQLPSINEVDLEDNPVSDRAVKAVEAAVFRAQSRGIVDRVVDSFLR